MKQARVSRRGRPPEHSFVVADLHKPMLPPSLRRGAWTVDRYVALCEGVNIYAGLQHETHVEQLSDMTALT